MSITLKLALLILLLKVSFSLNKVLIYPTTNPHYKLICGFGVPVEELDYETLVVGYVFKTKYKLPASVKQLLTHKSYDVEGKRSVNENSQNFVSTSSNDKQKHIYRHPENSTQSIDLGYRWKIYKALEALGDRKGISGRGCVLRSICETAEIPFHYHNGIYAEIFHIIFTPSSSVDRLSKHSDNEYFQAEMLGKSGVPCDRVFKECKRSWVDNISDIHDMTYGIFQQFIK